MSSAADLPPPPPPPPPPSGPEGKPPWYERTWGKALIAVGVIGVLANVFGDDDEPEAETATEEVAEPEASEPEPEPEEDDEPEPEPEPEEPESEVGTQDNPLATSETVQIGEWAVTLTETVLDADDEIVDASRLNEPTPDGVTPVLVRIDATYEGDDAAVFWTDVRVRVLGSDARTYSSSDNEYARITPDNINGEPEVRAGGEVSGNFLTELPSEAIDGALVLVEPTFSFTDDTEFFYEIS